MHRGNAGIVESLRSHRLEEGARLEELLIERCDGIQAIVANYRDQLPELQAAQQQKLMDRINAIDVASDDKRLEEELVFLANKSDVAEELDRLDAHLRPSVTPSIQGALWAEARLSDARTQSRSQYPGFKDNFIGNDQCGGGAQSVDRANARTGAEP